MSPKARGEQIRQQILRDVASHPNDIVSHISQLFDISRQAVHKHLKKLLDEDWLEAKGSNRKKTYHPGIRRKHRFVFPLDGTFAEEKIYLNEFSSVCAGLEKNVADIVFYGFTEMVNNAIDHSEGTECCIKVERDHQHIQISIDDNGEGIFKRITRLKQLADENQAILELYKGKLTTDPQNHSGEGIFFASKMFDEFYIFSHGLVFYHHHKKNLDVISKDGVSDLDTGTLILMRIALDSTRTDKAVFDRFSGGEDEDYAFNRTIIPVIRAKLEHENLVSRSQAKRLLARIDHFKYVLFNFAEVDFIGQAFADEIFRVFQRKHPQVLIGYSNACLEVEKMIKRAKADHNSG